MAFTKALSLLAMLSTAYAVAVPTLHFSDVTKSMFATEESVLRAPPVDLTSFGYGYQLPRSFSAPAMTYDAQTSHEEFLAIINGQKNTTKSVERREIDARASSYLKFTLYGNNGQATCTEDFDSSTLGTGTCYSGAGCAPYYRATVYQSNNAYFTLWKSSVCNDDHKSINPPCNSYSTLDCDMTSFNPSSYKTYAGCHSGDASDACTNGLVGA